jgi:GNAT superfamily N-acetyltransferase
LYVLARDDAGHIVGGLIGATVWGWLELKLLWVSEHCRGRGYGTRLLRTAEEEARQRGCHHALLDTFDFQARGFYEALGYRAFASLADFPRGHSRIFLEKALG